MGLAVQSLRVADYLLGIVYAVSPATVRARRESAQVLHVAIRIKECVLGRAVCGCRIASHIAEIIEPVTPAFGRGAKRKQRPQICHGASGVKKCMISRSECSLDIGHPAY